MFASNDPLLDDELDLPEKLPAKSKARKSDARNHLALRTSNQYNVGMSASLVMY